MIADNAAIAAAETSTLFPSPGDLLLGDLGGRYPGRLGIGVVAALPVTLLLLLLTGAGGMSVAPGRLFLLRMSRASAFPMGGRMGPSATCGCDDKLSMVVNYLFIIDFCTFMCSCLGLYMCVYERTRLASFLYIICV